MRKVTVLGNSRGFSLVEVLVALVLLSIGLLGLAKLQFWGVRHTGSAYFRTQATQIANEMVERMRANPIGVAGGNYVLNPDSCKVVGCPISKINCRYDPKDPGKVCEPEELAKFDLQELACGTNGSGGIGLLPDAGMRVRCDSTANRCRVEVCWSEAEEAAGGRGNGQSIVMLDVVP